MSVRIFRIIYISLAAFFWLLLTLCSITIFFAENAFIDPEIANFLSNYLLCLFFLFVFLFFKIEVSTKRLPNHNEYLWTTFITGTSTMLVSLFIKFFISSRIIVSLLLYTIFYHINLALITIFLASTFYVWKKLILHHRSAQTNIIWHTFEYLALISILSGFFIFDLDQINFYLYASPIIVAAVFLSLNLKWVAFLNYKEKIRSILLMSLILLICVTFFQQTYEHQLTNDLSIDLWDNVFILGMLAFVSLYAFSSVLILLFQLPTSSVFDKKIEEVMVFQKLNQSIQEGDSEEHIYELLLQSGINSVSATSGWLEIVDEKGNFKAFIHKGIDKIDIFDIKKVMRKNHILSNKEPYYIKNYKTLNYAERLQQLPYKSAVLLPLTSNNEFLGTLVLIKNNFNGFDKTAIDILYAFVSQASLAIKNYRLVSEALQNQRYREELKIAKEVQSRLLPKNMTIHSDILIHSFSRAADDIGGDYYDIYEYPDKNNISLVIGDVSGHGTTAAFNMAQMKGIFQGLVQMELSPDKFMSYANKAVSTCFEKRSFITLSIFVIDMIASKIYFSRAGHCPALYYSAQTKQVLTLEGRGLGLGIMRNDGYSKHIETQSRSYASGDVMVLYTDGIIEAVNKNGEEYGAERLQKVLEKKAGEGPRQITDALLENLYEFTSSKDLNDDYSIIVLKFV